MGDILEMIEQDGGSFRRAKAELKREESLELATLAMIEGQRFYAFYLVELALVRRLPVDDWLLAHGLPFSSPSCPLEPYGVTVYVPYYNPTDSPNIVMDLIDVLGRLSYQTYPIAEVIVVVDGSEEMARQLSTFPNHYADRLPLRFLVHGENKGLAAARNTALRACNTEFLANLDGDVAPDAFWLENLMLRFHFEDANLQRLGGVMGRMLQTYDLTPADRWRNVHLHQSYGVDPISSVPELYGCNGVWRTSVLQEVGGYDERFRTNGEDSFLSGKVVEAGWRMAYVPDAICYHGKQDDIRSVLHTAWAFHAPYPEHLWGAYSSDQMTDLVRKFQLNAARHFENMETDDFRRSHMLSWITFMGLLWRTLEDLRKKALDCPETLVQTAYGTYCAARNLMSRRLAERFGDDLGKQMLLSAGVDSLDPGGELVARDRLPQRDADYTGQACRATVGAVDQMLTQVWAKYSAIYWKMVRASHTAFLEDRKNNVLTDPVVIVNPPWRITEDDKLRLGVRAGSRWPFTSDAPTDKRINDYMPFPFFLATAAAMCKKAGHPTVIIDAVAEGLLPEEFITRLSSLHPSVILMEPATASHEVDLDWLYWLRRIFEGTEIVVAGPHATALGREFLEEAPYVDTLLLGEYEHSFLQLVEGAPHQDIKGLLTRMGPEIVGTEERAKLRPISEFPWPERLSLPMYNYWDAVGSAAKWPGVQMHASRGCPYQCIFCVWPQVVYDGQNYRTRDNADIIAEMQWCIETFGFESVYFDDDTFNIKDDRIIDLCTKITAAGVGVPISAMARADTSSPEALRAMARAGITGLKFGVETASPELMKVIDKKLDLSRVHETVRLCKELGITVHLTFSFGTPGETEETIRATVDLAKELNPHSVQFSLMTPFPGTKMFRDAEKDGRLLTRDWSKFDGNRFTVVQHDQLSREQLEAALAWAYDEWNKRHNAGER